MAADPKPWVRDSWETLFITRCSTHGVRFLLRGTWAKKVVNPSTKHTV